MQPRKKLWFARTSWSMAAMLLVVVLPAHAQEFGQVSSSLAAKIAAAGRQKIAVTDFTDLQGNVSELGRYLAEELSGSLADEAKGFRVVDRAHLKAILQEHKLASTGLLDPQTARQLGRFTGADTLVTGTITSAFGDSVRVSIKALDVETAEIIAQSRADVPKTKAIEELLAKGIVASEPPSNQGSRAATTPTGRGETAAVSVEENNLLFIVEGCRRSGPKVSCAGSMTCEGTNGRTVTLGVDWDFVGVHTDAIDDLGNQYKISMKNQGYDLQPNLPVNFSFGIDGVVPEASRINVRLGYLLPPGGGKGNALLRNIPIH